MQRKIAALKFYQGGEVDRGSVHRSINMHSTHSDSSAINTELDYQRSEVGAEEAVLLELLGPVFIGVHVCVCVL